MFWRFSVFFAILIFSCVPLCADYNRSGVADSSEIRKGLVETWFEAPLQSVRMNKPEIRVNSIGQKFQIRLEEADDSFSIFVAPYMQMEIDVYSDRGKSTEVQDVYPGDAAGSWVLVRDKKSGGPLRVRYYFSSDSDVFVQFAPVNRTGYADFVFYNCYASRGVPTGIPFSRFYTASFADIQKWTAGILPWNYTAIYTDNYHSAQQMIEVIRGNIPRIVLTEDAMYDEDGRPVYISSGKPRKIDAADEGKISVSGAGFLKWIADGIVQPLAGSCLRRVPLLTETVQYKDTGFQGVLSQSYSISFSLDWIRNLASAIISVRTRKNYMYNESGVDVSIEPFSAELTERGLENAAGFVQNSGYSVPTLKPLLYVLAASEPETFYFAAIRSTDRKSPEVKVFNECAVFFPYFDTDGHFQCVVFKDGSEMSFDDFCSRYYMDSVFLTRAGCTERFFPE